VTARAFLGRLDTDGSNYLELIREGLAYTGFGREGPRRPRIFIKPNLTFPSYQPGVMTSPQAVEAAIIALLDYTPDIWIGDSDSGGYNPFAMEDVYAATGIEAFAKRYGVKLVNLSSLERETVRFRSHGRDISLALPRLLTSGIDTLVTMPVPKIHMNTGVSLTFKNQWGCIPEPNDRLRLHPLFKEVVVAVNQAVKAQFAIIDGRFGLNVSGPMRGNAVPLNWLCVANDIGAGARVACELMQVPVRSVSHLRYAESSGLVPPLSAITLNTELRPFIGPKFYLRRKWTDVPGYLAFHHSAIAHLAYFSRWSKLLHRVLYVFREPFYDYAAMSRQRERRASSQPPNGPEPHD
jgi:uncharacterized protein (DUF362 family)